MIKNKTQDNRWKMLKLKDITEINPQSSKLPDYFNYIDLESVKRGRLINIQVLEKVKAPSRAQRVLSKGDVLFQTVRPYQKNNLFFDLKEGDYVASTGYALLRSNFNNKFLYYLISSNYFVKEVLRRCVGSNYPAITSEDLRTISVNIPSSEEQKAIVSIIEKWDKYIEFLDQKIQTKKDIKKYLQQVLLTGKVRLRDFKDKWQEVKLGYISSLCKGKAIKISNTKSGNYPVIAGGKISPYNYVEYNYEKVLTVSASGANAGFVSFHPNKIWASDCSVIKAIDNVTDILYLKYLLELKQSLIYTFQSGGAQPHVYPKDLAIIKLSLPSILEQKAISSILSKSDEEIVMLEKQKEIIEEQRKYLLNNLVTGEIRLPKFRNNK